MSGIRFSPHRLRSIRTGANKTQAEAAHAADVTEKTVRNWERGTHTPTGEVLAHLATLYGVQPGEFFIHEPEPVTGSDGRGKSHEPDTAAVGGSAGLAHQKG